jgi:hypothetical protein
MLPESDWLLWLNRLLQLAAASKRSASGAAATAVCDVGKDLANGVVLMTLLDYLAEQPLKTCDHKRAKERAKERTKNSRFSSNTQTASSMRRPRTGCSASTTCWWCLT